MTFYNNTDDAVPLLEQSTSQCSPSLSTSTNWIDISSKPLLEFITSFSNPYQSPDSFQFQTDPSFPTTKIHFDQTSHKLILHGIDNPSLELWKQNYLQMRQLLLLTSTTTPASAVASPPVPVQIKAPQSLPTAPTPRFAQVSSSAAPQQQTTSRTPIPKAKSDPHSLPSTTQQLPHQTTQSHPPGAILPNQSSNTTKLNITEEREMSKQDFSTSKTVKTDSSVKVERKLEQRNKSMSDIDKLDEDSDNSDSDNGSMFYSVNQRMFEQDDDVLLPTLALFRSGHQDDALLGFDDGYDDGLDGIDASQVFSGFGKPPRQQDNGNSNGNDNDNDNDNDGDPFNAITNQPHQTHQKTQPDTTPSSSKQPASTTTSTSTSQSKNNSNSDLVQLGNPADSRSIPKQTDANCWIQKMKSTYTTELREYNLAPLDLYFSQSHLHRFAFLLSKHQLPQQQHQLDILSPTDSIELTLYYSIYQQFTDSICFSRLMSRNKSKLLAQFLQYQDLEKKLPQRSTRIPHNQTPTDFQKLQQQLIAMKRDIIRDFNKHRYIEHLFMPLFQTKIQTFVIQNALKCISFTICPNIPKFDELKFFTAFDVFGDYTVVVQDDQSQAGQREQQRHQSNPDFEQYVRTQRLPIPSLILSHYSTFLRNQHLIQEANQSISTSTSTNPFTSSQLAQRLALGKHHPPDFITLPPPHWSQVPEQYQKLPPFRLSQLLSSPENPFPNSPTPTKPSTTLKQLTKAISFEHFKLVSYLHYITPLMQQSLGFVDSLFQSPFLSSFDPKLTNHLSSKYLHNFASCPQQQQQQQQQRDSNSSSPNLFDNDVDSHFNAADYQNQVNVPKGDKFSIYSASNPSGAMYTSFSQVFRHLSNEELNFNIPQSLLLDPTNILSSPVSTSTAESDEAISNSANQHQHQLNVGDVMTKALALTSAFPSGDEQTNVTTVPSEFVLPAKEFATFAVDFQKQSFYNKLNKKHSIGDAMGLITHTDNYNLDSTWLLNEFNHNTPLFDNFKHNKEIVNHVGTFSFALASTNDVHFHPHTLPKELPSEVTSFFASIAAPFELCTPFVLSTPSTKFLEQQIAYFEQQITLSIVYLSPDDRHSQGLERFEKGRRKELRLALARKDTNAIQVDVQNALLRTIEEIVAQDSELAELKQLYKEVKNYSNFLNQNVLLCHAILSNIQFYYQFVLGYVKHQTAIVDQSTKDFRLVERYLYMLRVSNITRTPAATTATKNATTNGVKENENNNIDDSSGSDSSDSDTDSSDVDDDDDDDSDDNDDDDDDEDDDGDGEEVDLETLLANPLIQQAADLPAMSESQIFHQLTKSAHQHLTGLPLDHIMSHIKAGPTKTSALAFWRALRTSWMTPKQIKYYRAVKQAYLSKNEGKLSSKSKKAGRKAKKRKIVTKTPKNAKSTNQLAEQLSKEKFVKIRTLYSKLTPFYTAYLLKVSLSSILTHEYKELVKLGHLYTFHTVLRKAKLVDSLFKNSFNGPEQLFNVSAKLALLTKSYKLSCQKAKHKPKKNPHLKQVEQMSRWKERLLKVIRLFKAQNIQPNSIPPFPNDLLTPAQKSEKAQERGQPPQITYTTSFTPRLKFHPLPLDMLFNRSNKSGNDTISSMIPVHTIYQLREKETQISHHSGQIQTAGPPQPKSTTSTTSTSSMTTSIPSATQKAKKITPSRRPAATSVKTEMSDDLDTHQSQAGTSSSSWSEFVKKRSLSTTSGIQTKAELDNQRETPYERGLHDRLEESTKRRPTKQDRQ